MFLMSVFHILVLTKSSTCSLWQEHFVITCLFIFIWHNKMSLASDHSSEAIALQALQSVIIRYFLSNLYPKAHSFDNRFFTFIYLSTFRILFDKKTAFFIEIRLINICLDKIKLFLRPIYLDSITIYFFR